MYDKLLVDGEPYISMNGEIICDEYLPEGNPINPESPFGLFIYMIIGRGFDLIDEMTNTFINDCDIISSNPKSLDRFYGASMGLPRPEIIEDGTKRYLTDREYAVYLYVRNCQLLTRLDLLSVFGHCMRDDNSDDTYSGVTVTDEPNNKFSTVDHNHYTSPETSSSNIGVNSNDDMDRIINHDNVTDEPYLISGLKGYTGNTVTFVNVPKANWSPAFLDFLTEYISIKGNVFIREVIL